MQATRPTIRPHRRPVPRASVRFDLRCLGCGYGVVVRIAPQRCPMCGASTWEQPRSRARVAASAESAVAR